MGLPLEWPIIASLGLSNPMSAAMRPNLRTTASLLCLSLALGACSSLPSLDALPSVAGDKVLGLVTPYRVEVVQGNVLTKELVAKVKPGMNRAQVRDLLGSPLLTDIFHDNRWDYSFSIRRQGAPYQQRQIVAIFDGDKLVSLDAPPDLPTENEFVAAISTFKPRGDAPKLALTDDERKALPPPVRPAAAATAVEGIGPLRSYPPLEAKTEPRT
jgi:outer membrane protein assembly factor BamE